MSWASHCVPPVLCLNISNTLSYHSHFISSMCCSTCVLQFNTAIFFVFFRCPYIASEKLILSETHVGFEFNTYNDKDTATSEIHGCILRCAMTHLFALRITITNTEMNTYFDSNDLFQKARDNKNEWDAFEMWTKQTCCCGVLHHWTHPVSLWIHWNFV